MKGLDQGAMLPIPQLNLPEGVSADDRGVGEKFDIPNEGAARFEVVEGDPKDTSTTLHVILANNAVSSSNNDLITIRVPC